MIIPNPIAVSMGVSESTQRFPMKAEDNNYAMDVELSMNIVAAMIPKNYGLITWNGSIITVS